MVDSIKGFAEVDQYTPDILIRLQQSVYTVCQWIWRRLWYGECSCHQGYVFFV